MDTVFMKMSDCPEIQGLCEYICGDLMSNGSDTTIIIDYNPEYQGTTVKFMVAKPLPQKAERLIWLPRQEDLQKMVKIPRRQYVDGTETREQYCLSYLVTCLCGFFVENYYPKQYLDIFTSMEQLWLAFVMKETHGKLWNGENWVR